MRFKTWRAWTTKELDRLESLRLDGKSAARIAVEMGRSEASVRNRMNQDGIRKPSGLMRWLEIFNAGPHTINGLARQLGVTKWAVKQAKRKLRRAGFEVPEAMRELPP